MDDGQVGSEWEDECVNEWMSQWPRKWSWLNELVVSQEKGGRGSGEEAGSHLKQVWSGATHL